MATRPPLGSVRRGPTVEDAVRRLADERQMIEAERDARNRAQLPRDAFGDRVLAVTVADEEDAAHA
jgi:hypothetical protein